MTTATEVTEIKIQGEKVKLADIDKVELNEQKEIKFQGGKKVEKVIEAEILIYVGDDIYGTTSLKKIKELKEILGL